MPEARDLTGGDLRVGLSESFEREITSDDVMAFAELSGDHNPLHVDAVYARETNYQRPIVHGAFQLSLASAMAGMYLPGRRVVLGAVRSRFPAPLYYPSRVIVRGEIVSWFPAAQSGMLRVSVQESAASMLTAEIDMAFSLHESRASQEIAPPPAPRGQRELVVVTGASGAVGSRLLQHVSRQFDVLGLLRHAQPESTSGDAASPGSSHTLLCDLEQEGWEAQASMALGERVVYALIHAAWPGAPRGGLLDLELSAIRRQVDFGGPTTIRMARWLAAHAGAQGRLVVLGSTAATLHPELSLAAYSLGKATLEHTVRLLAPELARRAITINAILPSYMPVGINQAKTERATLVETARVPVGRLCTPDDVCAAVDYFLSPGASFVTGQMLPLTGGRL